MGLTELKEKILSDAQLKAREITGQAEAEARRVMQKAEEDREKLIAQFQKEGDQQARERYQNIVTLARVSGRNKVLEVRRSMVNDVFSTVNDRLKELTADEFRKLAGNLLAKYDLPETVRIMVGKKNETMITQEFLNSVAAKNKNAGKYQLVKRDREFDYGLYLVTEWMEIDLTYEGILRTVREDMEMEVIHTLFGKG